MGRSLTRRVAAAVALLVLIAGTVFALQGLRFLPSPLMYGKPEWIVIGVGMDVLAIGGLLWLRWRS